MDSSPHPVRETAFALAPDCSPESLLAVLDERFRAEPPRAPVRRRRYLDTFDRRLMSRGETLHLDEERGGNRLAWNSVLQGRLRSMRISRAPAFAADLPQGPFRDALEQVCEPRRLLVAAEARIRGGERILRNADGKAIAHLALEEWRAPGERRRGPVALRLVPLRGYGREFRAFLEELRGALALSPPLPDHPISAFGILDRAFGRPPPALGADLEPALRTDDAVRRILRALLASMEANEAGTLDSLDPEFLHEFRVAVRRSRAAISRFRDVLPVPAVRRFGKEFRWLGSVTGPLRDIDVHLVHIADYAAAVPAKMRRDLGPLREHLEMRRDEERARLRRHLESARYRRLLRDWRAFLGKPLPARPRAPDALRPIVETARERITRMERRVRRRGRRIDDETPAEAVHELRLDCKKLRYLIEFSRRLFDEREVAGQVRELKRLQDVLGDFNDYEVQQADLALLAAEMEEVGRAPLATGIAMGRLIEALRKRQDAARRRFAARFAAFDSKRNRRAARRLFGPGGGK